MHDASPKGNQYRGGTSSHCIAIIEAEISGILGEGDEKKNIIKDMRCSLLLGGSLFTAVHDQSQERKQRKTRTFAGFFSTFAERQLLKVHHAQACLSLCCPGQRVSQFVVIHFCVPKQNKWKPLLFDKHGMFSILTVFISQHCLKFMFFDSKTYLLSLELWREGWVLSVIWQRYMLNLVSCLHMWLFTCWETWVKKAAKSQFLFPSIGWTGGTAPAGVNLCES